MWPPSLPLADGSKRAVSSLSRALPSFVVSAFCRRPCQTTQPVSRRDAITAEGLPILVAVVLCDGLSSCCRRRRPSRWQEVPRTVHHGGHAACVVVVISSSATAAKEVLLSSLKIKNYLVPKTTGNYYGATPSKKNERFALHKYSLEDLREILLAVSHIWTSSVHPLNEN